jgi:hypothetical protein
MVRFSCKDCTAPKRHPGCHDKCPEYLEQKAKNDAIKEAERKWKAVRGGLIAQRDELYHEAMKRNRGRK